MSNFVQTCFAHFLSLFGMILFWWGWKENLWVPPKSLPLSTLMSTKQLQKKKKFHPIFLFFIFDPPYNHSNQTKLETHIGTP